MPAKDYRELRVYQLAFESSVRIQELTKKFPAEERYSLIDQIRRSSRSICANIAEAWRKRRYPNHFVSKLSDSDAESAETIVWLDFALRFGYLAADTHKELTDHYEHVCSQLTLMMAEPEKWKPRSDVKR
ncbi:MAG: four helix bundle protein [Anaerolineae bacterium CG_4_9_14_3_um_filter_57_17]|nr:four helix bundle protein [bacterium]NCT20313.1 four helix bundle protein [bacterium]OIO84792.1 MAG: four helix bundle protein [Anaerolineae bacterium CG2_30_57_67]PJB64724.1 MAG: four helix bundle protein [Anaerolineae bacterium CG_4_9_14_3_um_filter_57_17]